MARRIFFTLLGLFWSYAIGWGQYVTNVSKVGTTAAPFLEIGVGSRAIGMGSAFSAVADDATAIYWNPAGLSRLPAGEAILIHTQWIADISFDFAALVIPIGASSAIGGSITSLTMGEMEVTTIADPDGTGEKFAAGDLAMTLSYAINLTDRFSIGFNGRYIYQHIWHETASGFALDVGTLFRTQFNDMKIGMVISNFGTKMRMEGKDTQVYHDISPTEYGNNDQILANLTTDKFSLPLTFRAGVSMDVLKGENNRLTLSLDAVHPNDNYEYINVGTEYHLLGFISLRFGYNTALLHHSEMGISAGAGTEFRLTGATRLKVDYAYSDFGRLRNAQQFSLGIVF